MRTVNALADTRLYSPWSRVRSHPAQRKKPPRHVCRVWVADL